MAFNLSENFKKALLNSNKNPQYILKITGIEEIFGAEHIESYPYYDQNGLFYNIPNLYYDRVFKNQNSRDWINLDNSTRTVSQQIEPDKGSGTSTSQMTFEIVDINQRMSQIVSPGFVVDEILGRKASIYYMLSGGTSFPQDSICVLYGVIEDVVARPGSVRITISSPQNLLRQDFIQPFSAKLTEFFHYRSSVIQDILYLARIPDGLIVKIRYINSGSLSITVSSNEITVNIVPGVTTASDIENLIKNSSDAIQLVEVDVIGSSSNVQVDTAGFKYLDDSSQITVDNVLGLIQENTDPFFKTYIMLNDEILDVSSIDYINNKINVSTAQRSLFNSAPPDFSKPGDEIKSFYLFEGNALELSLKLMISGANDLYYTGQYYGKIPGYGYVKNCIYFSGLIIKEDASLVIGDYVSITGVTTVRQIVSFNQDDLGSWIIISGSDIGDDTGPFEVVFRSKYNTLPIGCSISPDYIDVERFEEINTFYYSSIPTYRFYIKDSINMKDFLEQEVFFPASLYLCPRKGRISCSIARPAIGGFNTYTLNEDNVLEPENRAISRSLNQNFYNGINFYFDEDSIESDDFINKIINVDAESVQRFNVGIRPLVIKSKGLRTDLNADLFIEKSTQRFLDRYKFCAETINVKVKLEVGVPVEIADTIIYGSPGIQITDINEGSRNFQPRVWEIINKEINIENVDLTLLETKYGIYGRFGMVSPNSYVASGSTTNTIYIKKSFATSDTEYESLKWSGFVGEDILIRNEDWSVQYICKLVEVDDILGDNLTVSGLLTAPIEGMIIDIPIYQDEDSSIGSIYKSLFCYFNPQITVLSGVSPFEFTVSALDSAKFSLNQPIRVHNENYTIDSGDNTVKVIEINGNNIKTNKSLGFTPTSNLLVDLIGFIDDGKPYLLI